MKKALVGIYPSPQSHWVGDGFPVRSLFSYDRFGQQISPFLLLDYAGPAHFAPAQRPRGVGEHPHRGFETVTIVYQGEVAHRDSTGEGGLIGPGDVQWMTAAGGILHEEFHSPAFTRQGGALEMVQLWVNLPACHKLSAPRYQTLRDADLPRLALPENAGEVRLIAGAFAQQRGAARIFSELNVWDVRLLEGHNATLRVPAQHIAALVVLRGAVSVNDSVPAAPLELVLLAAGGEDIQLRAAADSKLLFLSGVPIAEPIVGYGPFVMNSQQEIETAMEDFRRGKFGQMPRPAAEPAPVA